ncbi:twin-arginine translocation signal domain-containing protein [Streptomyces sp. NPDC059466]|uniref:twin-arginine translocation signal domain-containing protein n=1 Tax=Streptomyces sp. NPDC059466 TaxID=3346843 RepID=UPI0036921DFF
MTELPGLSAGLDRRRFLRTAAALSGAGTLGTLGGCKSPGSESGAGASGGE